MLVPVENLDETRMTMANEELPSENFKSVSTELSNEMVKNNLIQYYREKKPKDGNIIEQILKQRDELPETNYVAMKIRIKIGDEAKINFLIQNLRNSNFEIKMFSSVENPQEIFYLLLDLPQSELEQ